MIWSDGESEITSWCRRNKVYDETPDREIEEIWIRDGPDDNEQVRLNGKFVWETAKRVCNFINAHDDLIRITTFGEYKVVMKKVMNEIKEDDNVEQKRRQMAWKNKRDDATKKVQRAKALIREIKRGKKGEKRSKGKKANFGKGS